MVKRYVGGIISGTVLDVTATVATGIWNPGMAAEYAGSYRWPGTQIPIEYFAVGAGGGATGGIGSVNYGSGAASGIVRTGSTSVVPGRTYTIAVGSGGAGNGTQGGNGGSSTITGTGFTTVTASGGNGAGNGFAGSNNADFMGAGTGVGQYAAGGGAGAGGNASNQNGGIGVATSWSGSSIYYGGGGIGGPDGTPGNGGGGGYGTSGGINSGGGGGGGGSGGPYGSGGSGVVLIRQSSSVLEATTTGSPTISIVGSYRLYKFTSSGSITF